MGSNKTEAKVGILGHNWRASEASPKPLGLPAAIGGGHWALPPRFASNAGHIVPSWQHAQEWPQL